MPCAVSYAVLWYALHWIFVFPFTIFRSHSLNSDRKCVCVYHRNHIFVVVVVECITNCYTKFSLIAVYCLPFLFWILFTVHIKMRAIIIHKSCCASQSFCFISSVARALNTHPSSFSYPSCPPSSVHSIPIHTHSFAHSLAHSFAFLFFSLWLLGK